MFSFIHFDAFRVSSSDVFLIFMNRIGKCFKIKFNFTFYFFGHNRAINRGYKKTRLWFFFSNSIRNINITLEKKYGNKSYQTIEPQVISTIDDEIAATFIHSFVESLDGLNIEEVQQIWLVYVGTRDYYLIGFKAPSQLFTGTEDS